MSSDFKCIRELWESTGTKRLDLRVKPNVDIAADEKKQLCNLLERMEDLADVLYELYELYQTKPDLYGDRMLAFVGNSIVREWPYKDPVFTSEEAYKIMEAGNCYEEVVSMSADSAKKKFKSITTLLTFEHWTPISFFRDIFWLKRDMSRDMFVTALKENYRSVWITKEEDKRIGKNARSFRTTSEYENHGIVIKEKSRWNLLSELSKSHVSKN